MTWFSTSAFHFELPGETWEERTVQLFRPKDDDRSAFALGRSKLSDEEGIDLEKTLEALPQGGPYDERQIVRNERRQVGPLDAQDVSLVARTGTTGEYYRFVSVAYYDLEVTFQFAGPITKRGEVDARATKTLETVRFRKR